MKKIVVFDIDGTLANIEHRRPFVERTLKEKDWKSFLHDWNVIKDEPNLPVVTLAKILYYNGFVIYITSGRPDCLEDTTKLWLEEHGIKYHKLIMRKTGDQRNDSIVKQEFLNDIPKDNILFVVDDRKSVVDMWRKNNLTVLQCAEGNY